MATLQNISMKKMQEIEVSLPTCQDTHVPRLGRQAKAVQRLTLLAAGLGYFMVILDTTIVNMALPTIHQALGASISGLQWITDGYILIFACLLLMAGSLSDRFGSKRVFTVGLAVFTLASMLCGIAPTLAILLLARVLQGIGAALLVPGSLTIITYAYPEARDRARAIGIWAMIAAIAAAVGPLLGGLLVQYTGWRTVFFINFPVGILAVFITIRFVARSQTSAHSTFDIPGQIAGILTLASLTFALIEGGSLGWFSPLVILAFLVFAGAVSAFIIAERRSANPMLPLSLFRSAPFSALTGIGLLLNFSFYGLVFLLSIYFQQVRGDSAWQAGLQLMPLTIVNFVAMPLSGQMTARIGPRIPILGGLMLGTLGMFAFLGLGSTASYPLVFLFLLAIGFGVSLAIPAMTTALLGTVTRDHAGIASGVLNASRQAGGAFGIAVLGSILGSATGPAALANVQVALGIAGALLVVSCMLTFAVPSKNV